MTTESGRLQSEKISVSCLCGKRYKVEAKKAGASFSCKACGEKVRIPRESAISDRSRNGILAELGIDSDVAKAKYKAEKLRETPQVKVYTCTKCDAKILANEVKDAYVRGELVCKGCRDSELVTTRSSEADEISKHRDKKAAVAREKQAEKQKKAGAIAAVTYGLLFFVGAFGPAYVVFGLTVLAALGVGAGFGAAGGAAVYAHRRASCLG